MVLEETEGAKAMIDLEPLCEYCLERPCEECRIRHAEETAQELEFAEQRFQRELAEGKR